MANFCAGGGLGSDSSLKYVVLEMENVTIFVSGVVCRDCLVWCSDVMRCDALRTGAHPWKVQSKIGYWRKNLSFLRGLECMCHGL